MVFGRQMDVLVLKIGIGFWILAAQTECRQCCIALPSTVLAFITDTKFMMKNGSSNHLFRSKRGPNKDDGMEMTNTKKGQEMDNDDEIETFLEEEMRMNGDSGQLRPYFWLAVIIGTAIITLAFIFSKGSTEESVSAFNTDNLNTGFDSNTAITRSNPDMAILPKKLYNVFGLESSGTQFVTGIITKALGLPKYREGSFSDSIIERYDTQVVHYSLPWGSTCQQEHYVPTVDVVLPSQCTRSNSLSECDSLVKEAWGVEQHGKISYPNR